MSRLYGWIAAAFAIMGAALLYMAGQRDKAKAKTKQARVALKVSEANRAVGTAVRKAQEQARQQSVEVQREADERPTGTRPDGHLRR